MAVKTNGEGARAAEALRLRQYGPAAAGHMGERDMNRTLKSAAVVVIAGTLFAAGYLAGQNKFGAPPTIIHISLIKWKEGTTEAQQQKALEGVKKMAATIPGIKNVWIKAARMQPRDYSAAFAIEFENRAAADRYAEHPAHEEWSKYFLSIREASISPQITN